MNTTLSLFRQFRWLNLPGALLLALLQRSPAVQVAATTAEFVAASPVGAVLRSAVMAAASLGAIHSLAGATTLSTNSHPSPLNVTAGSAIPTVVFGVIGAQGLPGSWTIGGNIPAGLSFSGRTTAGTVNTSSLTLTGTPSAAGTYSVTLRAWEGPNASQSGSPTFTYVINVAAAATVPVAPTFTTQPVNQSVTAGSNVTFTAAASGLPTPTLQWNFNGTAINGATGATYALGSVTSANAGSYSVTAANSAGSATSTAAVLTVSSPSAPAPAFTVQPTPQTMALGSTVVFAVAATNATSFQWRVNGVPIAGAASAMLVRTNLAATDAGVYTCVATNAGGTATSSGATLTVGSFSAASTGHLVNVSILTTAGSGAKALTVGATIGGGGSTNTLPLVVRAVGPTLATAFGLSSALADPVLTVNASGNPTALATNDNWGGGSIMSGAFASVGAFALPAASLDSAFVSLAGLAPNGYTVQVASKDSSSGLVLAEIYDAGDATRTAATPRLTNLSTLTSIDAGASLSAGFVLRGSTSRTLLVRGIGPSLAALGVGGTMTDPKLEFFNNDTGVKIAENDNWGGDPQLSAAMVSVGAFPLSGAATKDAVLLITLPPGAYSARVSDTAGGAGTAIVEIYEVP